jgi:tartrate dehydrogenase/decarboxylase/D-malate dehydrogenase
MPLGGYDARCQPPPPGDAMTKKTYRIAAIPGDGIGKEVMPEGLRVLQAAATRFGFALEVEPIEWASCDYYAEHGQMMPDDWKAQLMGKDALFFGAAGWPATVPDHVSLWGSLIKFRREFDQYINLRPARLLAGVPSPLANRKPGDIDMLIVRENTEGEYSSVGGVMFPGTEREFVSQTSIFTRTGSERLLRYAFELARTRPRKHVTLATKSNGISISMPWWDERCTEMAAQYPDVTWDKQHIDILSARFVLQPQRFDVVAATNLFGDILSDLGPACTGTIGIAPSANLNPERTTPSLFEPVHGSAPDIAGKGIANPTGTILSAAMLHRHSLGLEAEARAIEAAVSAAIDEGIHTGDLGAAQPVNTTQMGDAVRARLKR